MPREKYCEMAKNEKQLQFVHLCKGQTIHAMRCNSMRSDTIRYDTIRCDSHQLHLRSFVPLFVCSVIYARWDTITTCILTCIFIWNCPFFAFAAAAAAACVLFLSYPQYIFNLPFTLKPMHTVVQHWFIFYFFYLLRAMIKRHWIETRVVFVLKRENVGGLFLFKCQFICFLKTIFLSWRKTSWGRRYMPPPFVNVFEDVFL